MLHAQLENTMLVLEKVGKKNCRHNEVVGLKKQGNEWNFNWFGAQKSGRNDKMALLKLRYTFRGV